MILHVTDAKYLHDYVLWLRFNDGIEQARKDVDSLSPKLKQKLYDILVHTIAGNPYAGKRLLGGLAGSFSFRLTHKDHLVYSLDEEAKVIYIERAKTH